MRFPPSTSTRIGQLKTSHFAEIAFLGVERIVLEVHRAELEVASKNH